MAGRQRASRWKKRAITTRQSRARFFPTTGGILKTMAQDTPGLYLPGAGRHRKLHGRPAAISKAARFTTALSRCPPASGSCIGGPVMEKHHHIAASRITCPSPATRAIRILISPSPIATSLRKHFDWIEHKRKCPSESEIDRDSARRWARPSPRVRAQLRLLRL